MSVKLGLLATLQAKKGKGGELAVKEEGTVTWYAFKIDEDHYGIFDTFETDAARNAHLNGDIPQALGTVADDLLASAPSIQPVDVIAVK
jgi:quinol monooxygenase YgiN